MSFFPTSGLFSDLGSNPTSCNAFRCDVPLVSFNLGQFLSLLLVFLIFLFLKSISWLFCRTPVVGRSDLSPWLESGFVFWVVYRRRDDVPREPRLQAQRCRFCSGSGDDCDPLVKVVSARLL